MPRQHLASLAGNVPVVQQLNALAELHGRMRVELCYAEEPVVGVQLHLRDANLQPGRRPHDWQSRLSPAGNCAIALWTDRPSLQEPWQFMGAEMLGMGPAGISWRRPYPCGAAFWKIFTGWCSLGRHCVTIADATRRTASQELGQLFAHDPDAVICAFDSQSCSWLNMLPVHGAVPDNPSNLDTGVTLCDSTSQHLAAFRGRMTHTGQQVLIVFDFVIQSVRLILLDSSFPCPFAWLPASHTIVVLQRSLGLVEHACSVVRHSQPCLGGSARAC